MQFDPIDASLLVAAWFRGRVPAEDEVWTSNADQVLTLSLFYTGDISAEECARRFSVCPHMQELYDSPFEELTKEVAARDHLLIELLKTRPDLIIGGGDWKTPCFPTFRACGLTEAGQQLIPALIDHFPAKPDFTNWPDARPAPASSGSERRNR